MPHCEHNSQETRMRTLSNGRLQPAIQCLVCGSQVRAVKNGTPTVGPWDETLQGRYCDLRNAEYERVRRQRQDQSDQWWEKYDAYLLTETWRSKRARVLARDNYLCQACGTKVATQVHHLTYKRVFDEPLFDLVSVCENCHWKLHRDHPVDVNEMVR